eukprot:gene12653-19597_t
MAVHVKEPAAAALPLGRYDLILFDCDGVIWQGAEPIAGIRDALAVLTDTLCKRTLFVSNNSTKSRRQYIEKIDTLTGVVCEADQIYSSAFATACFLHQHPSKPQKVFVIGHAGLISEIAQYCTVVSDDSETPYNPDVEAAKEYEPVDAVVVGMDFAFNVTKLARATMYLQSLNSKTGRRPLFVLTNPDAVIPINNKAMPEAATLAAAVSANVGFEPDAVCGKPHRLLFDLIMSQPRHQGVPADRVLMVGDRLDTDVRFGKNAGIDTLLVYSGFEREESVSKSSVQPTYTAASVPDLVKLAMQ